MKLEERIFASPLLYTTELIFTILLENSTESMTKSLSFKTRALSMKLSENVLFKIFNKPELYIITPVSKLSNEQLVIIKSPLFSIVA